MLGLIQRVKSAAVDVSGERVGAIDRGILLLLGVEKNDNPQAADKLLDKLLGYRIFADAEGKMNLNVQQVGGGILVVSQFTLSADTRKGLRPSFSSGAPSPLAREMYDYFLGRLRQRHSRMAAGIFAADMQVSLVNDGPVTFLLKTD